MNKPRQDTARYVLVDFENVQPKNLELLAGQPFHVLVFVGANQAKVPFELASAMQVLGRNATYVKIAGTGRNALDFHIAYTIGRLLAGDPKSQIYVISKDKGFDPLIRHLKGEKAKVSRQVDIAEIPELRISVTKTGPDEQVAAVLENLQARGNSRPRKVSTLKNTINHLLDEKLSDKEMDAFLRKLRDMKVVTVDGTKVTYRFGKRRRR